VRPLVDTDLASPRQLGATHIIRGEKNSDQKKRRLRSGVVVDGITYIPIGRLVRSDVNAYLNEKGTHLPANISVYEQGWTVGMYRLSR